MALVASSALAAALAMWSIAQAAADVRLSRPGSASLAPRAHVHRYAESLIATYDANGDQRLQADEWKRLRGAPRTIDVDGDGVVVYAEMVGHIIRYSSAKKLVLGAVRRPQQEASDGRERPEEAPGVASARANEAAPTGKTYYVPERFLPQGLPEWFRARDVNGDAQLSLAEYAPTGEAQLAAEFERHDANGDGLITAAEATGKERKSGARVAPSQRAP